MSLREEQVMSLQGAKRRSNLVRIPASDVALSPRRQMLRPCRPRNHNARTLSPFTAPES